MDIRLINHCRREYSPDPLNVTDRILRRIPGKFLRGLTQIHFFDQPDYPVVKHVWGQKRSGSSRIHVYMGGFGIKSRWSVFIYNIVFLSCINDHIMRFVHPTSKDEEILSIRADHFNPDWMYLGWRAPLLIPIEIVLFLYRKIGTFARWLYRKRDQLIKEMGRRG